ncbi:hypothetical protein SELMODRAFT_411671 [Selaginella moellendorffii]|uniref:Uncharacterized protein n=1 Tax=Selaginella moellendorffii TaxID=88036 RepID=D8RIN6_SELML|nr:hypothetical protein SELMODRAFT_411671 [Selaginella moellendorffii]
MAKNQEASRARGKRSRGSGAGDGAQNEEEQPRNRRFRAAPGPGAGAAPVDDALRAGAAPGDGALRAGAVPGAGGQRFSKRLTATDVSQQNRLTIPKNYTCFFTEEEDDEAIDQGEAVAKDVKLHHGNFEWTLGMRFQAGRSNYLLNWKPVVDHLHLEAGRMVTLSKLGVYDFLLEACVQSMGFSHLPQLLPVLWRSAGGHGVLYKQYGVTRNYTLWIYGHESDNVMVYKSETGEWSEMKKRYLGKVDYATTVSGPGDIRTLYIWKCEPRRLVAKFPFRDEWVRRFNRRPPLHFSDLVGNMVICSFMFHGVYMAYDLVHDTWDTFQTVELKSAQYYEPFIPSLDKP